MERVNTYTYHIPNNCSLLYTHTHTEKHCAPTSISDRILASPRAEERVHGVEGVPAALGLAYAARVPLVQSCSFEYTHTDKYKLS
jgi:hypothetical protein